MVAATVGMKVTELKRYTVSCLSMGWNQIIIDVKNVIHYAYKHFFVLTFCGPTSQEACDVGREMLRGRCINRENHAC